LLYGSETVGLSREVLEDVYACGGRMVKIPIVVRHVRSLNVSVAAGVGIYEALMQVEQTERSYVASETAML
jgi:tRNA (cytidine/uridine-2'-O-)-methyltransferase